MLTVLTFLIYAKYFIGCAVAGGPSHARPILEYLTGLQEQGYDVAFATTTEFTGMAKDYNLTILDIGNGPLDVQVKIDAVEGEVGSNLMKLLPFAKIGYLDKFYKTTYKGLLDTIQKKKPDLILCDGFADACFDASIKNNIEYAISSTLSVFYGFYDYSYNPSFYLDKLAANWNFWDRFKKTWYVNPLANWGFRPVINALNEQRKELGVEPRSDHVSYFNNHLVLLNSLPGLEYNAELPPNVIQLGAVLPKNHKKMDLKTREWLDNKLNRGKKVAYMAFGSIAYHKKPELAKLFQGLRIAGLHILFASRTFNATEYSAEELENVHYLKWAPQRDILGHPVVVLFVSHGGQESLHESIEAGKPILVKPFFGDQMFNGNKAKDAGVGDIIPGKYKFTAQEVSCKAKSLISDLKYKRNIKLFTRLLNLKGKHNVQDASDFLHFVSQFGAQGLTTASQRMNSFQAANYDVISAGILLVVGLIILFSKAFFVIWRIWQSFRNGKVKRD